MTKQIPYVTEVSRYNGPKKPLPPEGSMTVKVPTLATLSETAVVLNQAKQKNLEFLKVYMLNFLNIMVITQKSKGRRGYHCS